MTQEKEQFDFSNLEEYLSTEICPEDIETTLGEIIIDVARHATRFDDLTDVEWMCNGIADAYYAMRTIRRTKPAL